MFYRILMFIILFTSYATLYAQTKKPAFLTEHNSRWVDSILHSLTLEEKIGQLLMPRGNYSGKPHDVDTLKKWVSQYKIGGLVFFASNPTTQARLTNELQSLSKVPLLIGQDFEWGVGMRLDSTDRFPYAVALGAIDSQDNNMIEAMGAEVARQCKRIGVHINYAPVVDVNNNPNNPVINFRSYGADPQNVAAKGIAYMKGLQSHKLLCTAKHFPGHGDTDVDSHHDLPLILHDKQRLLDLELFPFKKLIESGLSGIMTAHLEIPSLEPVKGLASTFSANVIFKILREEMNFQGLTFTDAMDMQGAVKNFPKGEAMVRALLAGNDILETFTDVAETVAAIKSAVLKGRISPAALDFKVKKILMAKSWVGLDMYQPVNLKNLLEDLNSISSDVLNHQLTEKSITCLKNDLNHLPVRDLRKKIAVLSVEGDSISSFSAMVKNYMPSEYFYIPKKSNDSLVARIFLKLSEYDLVLATVHLMDIRASKKYGLTPTNIKIISDLAERDNVVLSILGNPFILSVVPALSKAKTLIMSYQQNKYTENATAQVIFGAVPPVGQLPVNINSEFKIGMGVFWDHLKRLSYGVPEQVGINRVGLNRSIDSLMQLGLNERAFPGGVVQVAKDGKVIFSKAYGYPTYETAQSNLNINNPDKGMNYQFIDDAMDNPASLATTLRPPDRMKPAQGMVQTDHLYDLASITKISTSTLAVMQLMSENKFSLDSPLKAYYPQFQNNDKGNLIMKDLLTHRAGLTAWIPFWKDAVDTIATFKKALNLYPDLEKECIVIIKKPGFIKRIFGKKPTKEILPVESLNANATLWMKVLTPQTRTWKPGTFSTEKSNLYSVKVAENMFLNHNYHKNIVRKIAESPINKGQGYLYSDVHFYLYPEIIKNITGINFETYLNQSFATLGASSLCFNPYEKITSEKIIPTEYDSVFRQQLIHGTVHDEGAAMVGGVSGHAGLFGNANDLTKLMQMYLQKGYYGGIQYINPEVIDLCTSYLFPEEKNRRGIGFDKKDFNNSIQNAPQLASDQSYGHSGFTGTFTWVDPTYQLVYVFLSNRVYPDRANNKISTLHIRTEVGNQIIRNLLTGQKKI